MERHNIAIPCKLGKEFEYLIPKSRKGKKKIIIRMIQLLKKLELAITRCTCNNYIKGTNIIIYILKTLIPNVEYEYDTLNSGFRESKILHCDVDNCSFDLKLTWVTEDLRYVSDVYYIIDMRRSKLTDKERLDDYEWNPPFLISREGFSVQNLILYLNSEYNLQIDINSLSLLIDGIYFKFKT